MNSPQRRREWKGWHFFAITVLAVALIGGVWSLVAPNGAMPSPSATPTVTATP